MEPEPKSAKVRRKMKIKKDVFPKVDTDSDNSVMYQSSLRGNRLLFYMGHKYIKNNVHGANIYWKCTKWHSGCKARAITNMTMANSCALKNIHNHDEMSSTADDYN